MINSNTTNKTLLLVRPTRQCSVCSRSRSLFEAESAALNGSVCRSDLRRYQAVTESTSVRIRDLLQTKMNFLTVLCLVPVLSVFTVLSVRIAEGPACGPCDPAQCAPLPAQGCPAGSLLDSCGCCSLCAAAEGEPCGSGRRTVARRCGSGLECVRSDEGKKKKLGVCACKSNYEVCGTDGLTYRSGCALRSASLTAQSQGKGPINIQNKGRCTTGETDP